MTEEKRKILAVDDDRLNLEVLNECLSKSYQVLSAISGEAAIEIAKAKQPDLILLDIRMKPMNGYEVLLRLKASPQTKRIPIIFLSALDMPEDESYGFDIGAADYINKPINKAVVKARIANQLKIVEQREEIEHLRKLVNTKIGEDEESLR